MDRIWSIAQWMSDQAVGQSGTVTYNISYPISVIYETVRTRCLRERAPITHNRNISNGDIWRRYHGRLN